MNIKTKGDPRVTVAYDAAVTDGDGSCLVVFLEVVGIALFFLMIGVLR